MIVKAINDTVDSNDLVSILLIFEAYSRIHAMDFSSSSISQQALAIKKAMIEIRKFRAENQVVNALNIQKQIECKFDS
jgi:hypothetical protein